MAEATVSQDQILNALRKVQDPDLGRDIVDLGFVKDLKTCDGVASFKIELTTPACPVKEQLKEEARRAVLSLPGMRKVDIEMTSQVRQSPQQKKGLMLPNVKNIVPVASGKGGVGKSTVAANLAVALSQLGAKVGLVDMDVYGPSIPIIMGMQEPKIQRVEGKLIPPVAHGIKFVSMGFFTPKGEAVVWRGPMLHKTVEQFLGAVDWGELDYLIVDLPPGTGDVQLSLCQIVPLTGAAVVSTPQDVALGVAEKAVIMFRKLRTPVLGMIENMSGFACTECGNREEIFGSGGARKHCMANDIPFLGEIPLSTDIRETSDAGMPIVLAAPDSPSAKAFLAVAKNVAAQVSVQNIGETKGDRPEPAEYSKSGEREVSIKWKDGHESLYPARLLRLNCSCAQCVDEITGKKRLADDSVPEDVKPLSISPVGRYALHFQWSDGHSSGIYTFEHLRGLCPCCKKSE